MDIMSLKPADLGGAIGHVAATQLYMAMTEDDDQPAGPRTWFGSDPADGAGIETDVLDMATYVNGRDIPAEQLWRWGMINGIVLREVEDFHTLPIARRLAFEIFTDTCMRAHHRLELAQLDAQKLIPLADPAAPALKIEDSIFEPHGSLGDQEDYQKQWLADQEAADRRRLEETIAAAATASAGESQSLGAPIDDQDQKPAGLSAGVREERDDAEEASTQGQAAGSEAAPDPQAQGTVSGISGDLGDGEQGEQARAASSPEQLAPAVADAEGAAGESELTETAPASHPTVEAEARIGGEGVTQATPKTRKGKSTS